MTNEAFESLADRLVEHGRTRDGRRAVVCDGRALTYGALLDRSRRTAAGLTALGFEPGSERRVGILASNGLDVAVVVAACQLAGVTIVPLPTVILPDAQARMIDDAGVMLLFHDADHAESAHAAAGLVVGWRLTVMEIGGPAFDRYLAWQSAEFEPVTIEPDWVSDINYSSGTTGIPKGIVQRYDARTTQNRNLGALGTSDRTQLLQTVGFYSNFGLASLYLMLWWGGTLFLMRKFSGPAVVELLAREPIDMAWFAPATLVRTLEAPGFDAAVHGKSAVKLVAGAPLGVAVKRRVIAAWAGPFFDLYGQSETGTLTLLPAHAVADEKLGSVGRAIPSVSLRILDESGRELPPGSEGEIAGHSATLMAGYHGRHGAGLASHWEDELGRRYIRTGDMGRLDRDGYLWLSDRKKDMIISGGQNIYPADIERVLQDHPAILEAAVVGFPSARWGETPVAFVALRTGVTAEAEEIRTWVNERVARVQRVAAVRVLPALPQGTMGKTLKRELRDRYGSEFGVLP